MFRTVNKVRWFKWTAADVIIFVYEVPRIFWHYINVDEVSWITLKKLLQSAMELLQIATPFLLQSATRFITNCDRYYKVRWIYYKSRQVLQSEMIITNCDSTPPLFRFLEVCKELYCRNGGKCAGPTAAMCKCPAGYGGTFCQKSKYFYSI